EVLNLREAFVADSSGDVVGFRGRAETWSLWCFFERHGRPGFRQALDLLRQLEIDVSVEQDVDLTAEIAGANVLVAQIRVRNFALVERITNPSDRISIRPRHPHAEARHRRLVRRHIGEGRDLGKVESQFRGGRHDRVVQSSLTGKNPRPYGKLGASCIEFPLRNLEIETCQAIAGGKKRFLSSVLQQINSPDAGDASKRMRGI